MGKFKISNEVAGSFLLVLATTLAITCRNSSAADWYQHVQHLDFSIRLGSYELSNSLMHWTNDFLMAIFFIFIGCEIKREFVEGHLNSWRKMALPLYAAFGGIAVPALIYLTINFETGAHYSGWAIPSATDIAFALGALSLFGSRLPIGLKVFLTSIAVFDDIAAIAIIGIFYGEAVNFPLLMAAIAFALQMVLLNVKGTRKITPFLVLGLIVWIYLLKSGVHATLAGIALGTSLPHKAGETESPLLQVEHYLKPYCIYFIIPIFAFLNAGISLEGLSISMLFNSITFGIATGLFFGKQIGIMLLTYLSVKFFGLKLPQEVSWLHIYGASILAGIGFTMSLFISSLAFTETLLQDEAKLGILLGSGLSIIIGLAVTYYATLKARQPS